MASTRAPGNRTRSLALEFWFKMCACVIVFVRLSANVSFRAACMTACGWMTCANVPASWPLLLLVTFERLHGFMILNDMASVWVVLISWLDRNLKMAWSKVLIPYFYTSALKTRISNCFVRSSTSNVWQLSSAGPCIVISISDSICVAATIDQQAPASIKLVTPSPSSHMDLADFPAMACAAAQDPRVCVSSPCCFDQPGHFDFICEYV